MHLFFDPRQMEHRPSQYFKQGRMVTPVENPTRPAVMREALLRAGAVEGRVPDAGLSPIHAVHDEAYVAFLHDAYERIVTEGGWGPEMMPNVHPYRGANSAYVDRGPPRVTGTVGLAGWYMGDMSCALGAGTWTSAYWSAQTAIAAADAVLSGASSSYALCRPPGHHAYRDRASGFCFLNNAAIAAERLAARFGRVAILDFDTHHGDGTQAIFYGREDVLFASVHTDPAVYYPWFVGYADETGAGAGAGTTLNLPLAPGADDQAFVAAVERLATAVADFNADALVVSAGWDAHHEDPLSVLAVTTGSYSRIGTAIGRLGLPTVVVQEGGYSLAAVAECAPAFTEAFLAAHLIG